MHTLIEYYLSALVDVNLYINFYKHITYTINFYNTFLIYWLGKMSILCVQYKPSISVVHKDELLLRVLVPGICNSSGTLQHTMARSINMEWVGVRMWLE